MISAELIATGTHPNSVYGVAFSSDGKLVASASLDHSIKLWDAATGEELARIMAHGDGVCGVAFAPDDATLCSASMDSSLKIWNVASRTLVATLSGHQGYVEAFGVSRDRKLLASG